MRVTIGAVFAAALLTLCVGVQILEASGRWDRTIDNAGDEAIVVTVVLCVGAALAAADAGLGRASMSETWLSSIAGGRATPLASRSRRALPDFFPSPPLRLRI